MMAKRLPAWFVVGFTAITSFTVLFATDALTQPILDTRANRAYLDLINLDDATGLTIDDAFTPTGDLLLAGIQEVKVFRQQNAVIAVTYKVSVTGYASGLSYDIGIRNGLIQVIRVVSHNETPSYGADVMTELPTLLAGIAIDREDTWTSLLLSRSTGVTLTRRALLNSLAAIRSDYAMRIQA
jgi:Na+-translocating ferredoxin:NAD+ oxidoreductase RnfG subunit